MGVVFWVIFYLFVLDLLGFEWSRVIKLVEYRYDLFCYGFSSVSLGRG